jgi:hypothetical protein
VHDITERKRAEEAFRKAKEIQNLAENAPIAVTRIITLIRLRLCKRRICANQVYMEEFKCFRPELIDMIYERQG